MANRFMFGIFIVTGMLSLCACTTVQTAGERQTYFESTSRAKLAWQPMPNESTSFQGCSWGSENYPCQPYSKLNVPKVVPLEGKKSSIKTSSSHKKIQHRKLHQKPKPLPLCQPAPAVNTQVIPDENHTAPVNKTNT